jgi:hypothetical protein
MKTNTIKSIGLAAVVAMSLASCAELTPTGTTKGCTNPAAANYDPNAGQDNGGCVVINEVQYSMFYKYTATWCGPCGDWGGPAFVGMCDAHNGDMLAFTLQSSDDFQTTRNSEIFTAFSAKWPYGGTPNFQANNVSLGTNVAGADPEIAAHNAVAPEAGIGIHYSIGAGTNAGKLNINVYVKYFKDVNAEYYAGVYILHKNIIHNQNVNGTYDPNYLHHHVMMDHVTGVFGDVISTGAVGAGKVYHLGFVYPYTDIPELDLSKMEVVGILWKKNGNNFDLVNVTPNE